MSNPKVPRDLETIAMRCLEREPARRYASADAVGDELEALAQRRADHRSAPARWNGAGCGVAEIHWWPA